MVSTSSGATGVCHIPSTSKASVKTSQYKLFVPKAEPSFWPCLKNLAPDILYSPLNLSLSLSLSLVSSWTSDRSCCKKTQKKIKLQPRYLSGVFVVHIWSIGPFFLPQKSFSSVWPYLSTIHVCQTVKVGSGFGQLSHLGTYKYLNYFHVVINRIQQDRSAGSTPNQPTPQLEIFKTTWT